MNKQPEALRLADALHRKHNGEGLLAYCEAEIRHLHKLNTELLEALREMLEVHGVRWEHVRGDSSIPASWVELSDKARAAIAKAEAK